jgi:peptidoglycan hydrolase-like protein with peptidoglycan-binding domain
MAIGIQGRVGIPAGAAHTNEGRRIRRLLSGTLLATTMMVGCLVATAAPASANHHGIAPAPVTCAESIRPVLRSGSTHACVASLQHFLKSIAFISRDAALDPGPIDAHFGTRTGNAVERYQRLKGLSPDRIVGTNTWGVIAGDCAIFYARGAGNVCHTQVRY